MTLYLLFMFLVWLVVVLIGLHDDTPHHWINGKPVSESEYQEYKRHDEWYRQQPKILYVSRNGREWSKYTGTTGEAWKDGWTMMAWGIEGSQFYWQANQ